MSTVDVELDPPPVEAVGTGNERFAVWREHHAWSLGASLRRLGSRPIGSLLTITVMGLALALPLAFALLLLNVERLGDALGRSQTVDVYVKLGQDQASVTALAGQLRQRGDVAGVVIKTPQQGLDELSRQQGFSDALHELSDNPLPYVIQLTPSQALSAQAVAALVDQVRVLPAVDTVQDGGTWRQRLDALLGLGGQVVLGWSLMLALAALLVVGNTVRVDISGRIEEIGVLLLLGASPRFIRRPYLYAGIWYGLLGGGLAVALAVGVEYWLAAPAAALSAAYGGSLQLDALPLWVLVAVPVGAAVLGWIGARLVSGWQLRRLA
ncbi:permease-like cell division protein FtsX [Frateuria aurantia]